MRNLEERVQKLLARAGVGSRRHCETLIEQGRVTVNGRTISLGSKADPMKDEIRLDGQRIASPETAMTIMLYKPRGVVSTTQSQFGEQTVLDLVDVETRLYPIGRLDKDSEGLMLLSNRGELTNRLTHPRFGHEKEYRVLLNRSPDLVQIQTWRRGVVLSDGTRTQPAKVWLERESSPWVRVILTEGRKRQIRESAQTLGLFVRRLIRVRMGGLELKNLKPGEWRILSSDELSRLESRSRQEQLSPRKSNRQRDGKRRKS